MSFIRATSTNNRYHAARQVIHQPDLHKGHCSSGLFDPGLWVHESARERHRAAAICQRCPVLDTCRDWAIRGYPLTATEIIVLGGLTEREIRRIREPVPTRRDGPPTVRERVKAERDRARRLALEVEAKEKAAKAKEKAEARAKKLAEAKAEAKERAKQRAMERFTPEIHQQRHVYVRANSCVYCQQEEMPAARARAAARGAKKAARPSKFTNGTHKRWHTERGLVNDACPFCQREAA